MENVKIVGYPRTLEGKKYLKELRSQGYVPGILYGKGKPFNFYVPAAALRSVIYTPKVYYIFFNIEGREYKCLLQDVQFHPVSEMILHVDLMELADDKKIKMHIPISISGNSPGVAKGGLLAKKIKKLKVLAYPDDMPSEINVNVSNLDLGKTIKVREIEVGNYSILNSQTIPVVSVEIPRALRSKANEKGEAAKK
jgi:large subunit ribosomal protein L25